MQRVILVVFALVAALAVARPAVACTVCANPNIDVQSGRKTERSRLRLDLRVEVGGARAGKTTANDARFELVYALRPIEKLELSLVVPALYRSITTARATKVEGTPGDLELAAAGTLWTAIIGRFSEALTFTGGVKLPTAPPERGADGVLLSSILQPGCNAVTPNLGVAYAFSTTRWGFSAGGGLFLPFSVRDAPHAGESIRSNATLELRAAPAVSARAGIAMRLEPTGELRPDVSDPNSGGFVGSIVSENSFSVRIRGSRSPAPSMRPRFRRSTAINASRRRTLAGSRSGCERGSGRKRGEGRALPLELVDQREQRVERSIAP